MCNGREVGEQTALVRSPGKAIRPAHPRVCHPDRSEGSLFVVPRLHIEPALLTHSSPHWPSSTRSQTPDALYPLSGPKSPLTAPPTSSAKSGCATPCVRTTAP